MIVTWQEELRALDAELADKGITPAEYRRRRDNLLAAASGGFPPASQVAPQRPEPPQPQIPHVQPPPSPIQQPLPPIPGQQPVAPPPPSMPQQVAAPQPVPSSWPASGQQFSAPVMPSAPGPHSEDTAVLPPWTAVTELPMYQPSGADQQTPAPQYAPRLPLTEDVFSTSATKQKSRAALLVVVVVVLLLLLAGGWWFGIRPRTEAAAPPPPPKPLHLDDLPALPGAARVDRAELSVFEAQNRGLFDAREGDFLQADKVSQVTFTGSVDGRLNYVVFAFVTDNPTAAKKTSSDLLEYQDLGGLRAADGGGLPDQVKVLKLVAGDQVQYRAVYASGLNAVMVAVAQTQPVDEKVVAKALHDAATALLTKAPAS
jgi:hypothetical protein